MCRRISNQLTQREESEDSVRIFSFFTFSVGVSIHSWCSELHINDPQTPLDWEQDLRISNVQISLRLMFVSSTLPSCWSSIKLKHTDTHARQHAQFLSLQLTQPPGGSINYCILSSHKSSHFEISYPLLIQPSL